MPTEPTDPETRHLRVDLGYNGARFAGWARQPTGFTAGKPTVEGTLADTLRLILGETESLTVAGRTDTGVHARQQVVSFATRSRLPPAAVLRLLRSHLPPDIWVLNVAEVSSRFDARRSVLRRWYRYALWRGERPSPEWVARSLVYPDSLDLAAMRQAAAFLVGRQDRRALVNSWAHDHGERPERSTVRTIFVADLLSPHNSPLLLFEICGDAFLRQMVRTIVGSLLWVGGGRWTVEQFTAALRSGDRRLAGPTAAAHGLTLWKVDYPESFSVG